MSDYTKMIEHIKLSEIKLAAIAKEIKEFREEIKKLDDESEVMKAKEKQLNEELEYKRKIVNEKEWEILNLKRLYETWTRILEEKKAILASKTDELESTQQKVWDTRRSFYNSAIEFVENFDFVFGEKTNIGILIKKQEERMNLLQCVEELDKSVNIIEKEHCEVKAKWDLQQHLEKERECLLKHEQSPEVIRLHQRIGACQNELESLEKELAKYCPRATMTPRDLIMTNFHQNPKVPTNSREPDDQALCRETYSFQEKRLAFVPKMPRFPVRAPYLFEQKGKYNNNQRSEGTDE